MALRKCKLCGKVFDIDAQKYCQNCMKELVELYGSVHEYMRDHYKEKFDIKSLAEGVGVDPMYINALVELGYIDTLGSESMNRDNKQKLAEELTKELEKTHKSQITTYGGGVYSRKRS